MLILHQWQIPLNKNPYLQLNVLLIVCLSSGPAHKILTWQLKIRKVLARCVPMAWLKNEKATRINMPFLIKIRCQNCDQSEISELLTVDGTWIYKFKPQGRINNTQWLCKDQARHVILKQKVRENVSYVFYLNSDWHIVQT